jgi:hypothetical protein
MWTDIVGYEGMYQVNKKGEVYSLKSGRKLKPYTDSKGYKRVDLFNKGKVNKKVHRLVAQAFIPNPKEYLQVNHINGVKGDNRVENLEWCNNSQNQRHSWSNGRKSKTKGESNGNSKLTKEVVIQIKDLSKTKSDLEISRELKVPRTTVYNITKNRTWKHIGE